MSRKTAAAWPSSSALRRSISSACIRSIRPTSIVADRAVAQAHRGRSADAIVTRTEGLAIGVTAADCGPMLFVDPQRARDRRGACRLEGRADRRAGIDHRCDGKTRRRARRHRRRDRPADPAARATRSATNSSSASSRPMPDNALFFIPSARDGHAMFDLAGFIRMRLENAGVLMIDDHRRRHLCRRALLQLSPLGASQGAGLRPPRPRHRAGSLNARQRRFNSETIARTSRPIMPRSVSPLP